MEEARLKLCANLSDVIDLVVNDLEDGELFSIIGTVLDNQCKKRNIDMTVFCHKL